MLTPYVSQSVSQSVGRQSVGRSSVGRQSVDLTSVDEVGPRTPASQANEDFVEDR